MADNGDTKDDVKVPDGDVGDKIHKLFPEKETSMSRSFLSAKPPNNHC